MKITKDQLVAILGKTKLNDAKIDGIVDSLNQTFDKYQIDSNKRVCHFLAQVLHESGAFKYSEEIWGPTAAQAKYDTRVDLGNTPEADGDGYTYRGRGWIQLTGKANYIALGRDFNMDFVTNPDLVANTPYDGLAAGWFWNKRKLNTYADNDDITTITKKINGGLNGFDDRKNWLTKARAVLPYEIA